jgi:hypothetical protein
MSRASRKATSLGSIRDQLDSITEKLDEILCLIRPNEKIREQSEIVAAVAPVSSRHANEETRRLSSSPIRVSDANCLHARPVKKHPTLGSL